MAVLDADLHFVRTLDDLLELRSWLSEDRGREWIGFDIETEGLNVGRDKIRLVQIGDRRHGWAMPYAWWGGFIHELFERIFPRMRSRLVAHNVLFDSKFLARDGMPIASAQMHDSMVMQHLTDPMHSTALKTVCTRRYGPAASILEGMMHSGMAKQGWTWATAPVDFDPYWMYGALDPVLCATLAEDLWPGIQEQRLLYDIELGCIRVLRDAEIAGMRVDLAYNADRTHHHYDTMDRNRPLIPDEIKNPGSDAQVLAYLQKHGASLWKTTDKGNLSCDDDVLAEQEAAGIPGAQALRAWRKSRWLVNSYFSNITELNVDGIVHPNIRPMGARTSRMSITAPALQTIPRGPEVRDAFIAREGHTLIAADYEQLELRILASLAHEENLLQAIREGRDMHSFVAAELYGPDFTKEQRQIAKNGQFAIVYGSGESTFAHTAGIPLEQAKQFFQMYAENFPGVARFQRETIHLVHAEGHVKTPWGRRLPVEKDKAYAGVNYIVQPTATSDLIKLKIIECSYAGLHDFFRLPVHDELIFEVPDEHVPEARHLIEQVMSETALFAAPLTAEADAYKRWGDKTRDPADRIPLCA